MSKIIETLKASSMEFKKKESEIDSQKNKTSHELTQEQLADIYFSGSEKIKKSEYPTVIKVSERPRSASLIPWAAALAVAFAAVFVLVSGKRLFIDVRVMNERAAVLNAVPDELDISQESAAQPLDAAASLPSKTMIHLGDPLPLQDFVFDGAAKLKSSKDRVSLTLVNSSVSPYARAVLRFESPMNFAGSKIIFYAKGIKGGENVAFALKDKDNISAFNKNKIYPFPGNLTSDWQRAEIPLLSVAREFDVRAVTSLRFEVGSKDTDNKPGDTVIIKDLRVVPL